MSASYQDLPPARYTVERVARRLDCTVESVYVITRRRILKALGNPPSNGTKYYAAVYIERLCQDEAWLARMSDALVKYKWDKNHEKEQVTV